MVIYIPQCVTRSLPAPKVYVDNVGQDSQSRPIREFHFSGERFAGRTRQDETSKVSMSVMAYPNTLEGFFSIVKRRMNLSPGSMALGLDQTPESLLPAFACRWVLPITVQDIVLVTALFFVCELVASRALYTFKIRDRPY